MMTLPRELRAVSAAYLCRSTLVGIAAIAVFSGPVIADETDEPGGAADNIIVTGVRTTDILTEIPSAVSVVRLDEIEARNDTSIPDLLHSLPGIHVVQPSGQGGVTRIFVRGGDQDLTMVLVDGIRVNDPLDARGSAFDFSTVNINDVERVEIVRGPQSAVYGSDALAGVINIISKGVTAEFGGSVFAETGTDGYLNGAIDFSGPIDDVGGFALFVTAKDDGEPIEGTTFNSESASGRLSFANGDSWDIRIFGNYSDSDGTAFPEDSGGYDLAVLRDVDARTAEQLKLGLDGSIGLSDRSRLNVLATWYDLDSSYFSPGVAPGIRDPVPANGADSQLERTDIAINVVVNVSEHFAATVGVDYYDEAGAADGFVEFFPGFSIPSGFRFDRNVTGFFGELHYQTTFGATLLASIRRDDPDAESGETTSKLGSIFRFNDDRTTVRANWGQGFSLPGFFALASPLVGNPDLRPQTSESFDIGVTQWSTNRRIGATLMVFRNEFDDLIDFDSTVFSMVNRDRLEVDGAELQLDYAINKELDVSVQATYLDMKVRNTAAPVRQRPDWRASMTMRWAPSDRWLLDASWLNVGRTFDSSIPTGDRYLDGYDRVDVTATFKPTDRTSVLLSIDNLFDAGYAEAIGFPSPGTRARLGIRSRF